MKLRAMRACAKAAAFNTEMRPRESLPVRTDWRGHIFRKMRVLQARTLRNPLQDTRTIANTLCANFVVVRGLLFRHQTPWSRFVRSKYRLRAQTLSRRSDTEMASKIPTASTFGVARRAAMTRQSALFSREPCRAAAVAGYYRRVPGPRTRSFL